MRKTFLGLSILACAGVIAIACGDEAAVSPGTPDGGSVATTPPGNNGNETGTTPVSDAGTDEDAESVTDGGVNLDPNDASDDDAGDAAPCNVLANDAPKVLSKCSSQIPGLTGGALVAGKYFLVRVEVLAPATFCSNQFTPTAIAETLDLAVDTAGVGTAQTITAVGNRAAKTATLTLDPPDTNASPLQLTSTCPPKNGGKTTYASMLKDTKQLLVLHLGYGQGGEALYRYEKQ